jgi:ferredoxin
MHHGNLPAAPGTVNLGTLPIFLSRTQMAYVITDACIKDLLCVDACPTDCIHPKKDEPTFEAAVQLFVDPSGCIDCGACVPACTSDAIHPLDELSRRSEALRGKKRRFLFKVSGRPVIGQTQKRFGLSRGAGAPQTHFCAIVMVDWGSKPTAWIDSAGAYFYRA